MPLQATSGAASYDGFGGGVVAEPNYIESCFSTYLYTGTGNTQTITNEIDLSTKGGLVWTKSRNAAYDHWLFDTARGVEKKLTTNTSDGQGTTSGALEQFNANGYRLGYTGGGYAELNESAKTYVSWTFRKQPKFFDVVTYTGTGANRTISHSLGSVPGWIIVKRTDTTADWQVYHRSLANTEYLVLNSTAAKATGATRWNSTTPTSTVFSLGTDASVNANGGTYIAYLFAHDAGGFGLTGTDNVISCGSFTTDGSGNATVNLGYEPQWVMFKASSNIEKWFVNDIMRGMPAPPSGSGTNVNLFPNSSVAESIEGYDTSPTSTGFVARTGNASRTYIYIAIRRGPMKVPTSGTSVFAPSTAVEPQSSALFTAGFSDMTLHKPRLSEGNAPWITDRLRGNGNVLQTPYTSAEATYSTYFKYDSNAGAYIPASGYYNNSGGGTIPYALYAFKRAPSFFDEVCYTGLRAINNTTPQVVSHNLGVAPELVIFKCRSAATISSTATNWATSTILGGVYSNAGYLNTNDSFGFSSNLNPADGGGVSASSITIGYGAAETNATGNTYVAYLFATCAGVSKVGSYTGTATTKQIDCGFTGGARFVLIKRTDSTGDWYVWDTARGIVSGNDPYLLLNSTAAEVTNTDYIDTYSAGFEISSTAPAAINASGGSYIFLAIA